MKPLVTILLPTHNRAGLLDYAIRSVLWQSVADFELLIVGDGCTDNTSEIVNGFSDPRIRWFDLPKAPLSGYANRNIALRQARGNYIAYAQDDDILFPDHIEKLLASIEDSGNDWTYSRPLWVMPDGVVIPFSSNLTLSDELDHFLNASNHVPSNCAMHTRDALERAGFWPEDVAGIADWHCWQQIIRSSESGRASCCPFPTALHFRATWRTHDFRMEKKLREIAESTWWPKACRLPVPEGATAQRVVFEALSPAPHAWVDNLRAATAVITDRLAWAWSFPSARNWSL